MGRDQLATNLEGAVSLEESDGPFSQTVLDMLGQLAGPGVGVHEGRVGLHQQLVQGDHPVLEDLPHPVLGLVLPQISREPDVAAELEIFLRLLPVTSEAVDDAGR